MLPVGWPWAPLITVWEFIMMTKCTLASTKFLNYIILSGHRKFCEIWLENEALKLIWGCWHDQGSAEINGLPCRQQPAWSQDEDRRLGEGIQVCQPGKSSICKNSPTFKSILLSGPMERLRTIAWTSWRRGNQDRDGGNTLQSTALSHSNTLKSTALSHSNT